MHFSTWFHFSDFVLHSFLVKEEVALCKDPVYFHHRELLQPNLFKQQSNLKLHPQIYLRAVQTLAAKIRCSVSFSAKLRLPTGQRQSNIRVQFFSFDQANIVLIL
jgi:hypothetical protein